MMKGLAGSRRSVPADLRLFCDREYRPLVELRYTKGNGPLYLAAGDETLWAAHGFGEVAAFESTTMEPTGVSADLGPNVNGIALGGDRL